MKRQNERAIEDDFNDLMREVAAQQGSTFRPFSLGGQDRDFNADYILAGANEFTIVEFKFSEKELAEEDSKPRSRRLCRRLSANATLRDLQSRGHFAAWRDSVTGELRCNSYRSAVCKKNTSGEVKADLFCNQFFSPPPHRTLTLDEMLEYLALLEASSDGEAIQLYGRKPGTCISVLT